jgi:hypothetical protein
MTAMFGNVNVDDASSIVGEDDKDEQRFQPNRVVGEKVDGSHLSNVIIENVLPVCDGGFGPRTMYLATEASEILMPNFISSL